MSTPAAAVLSPEAPATPAAPTAPSTPNQSFFNDWFKPEAPDAKDLSGWLTNKNFSDPATLVKSYRGLETEAASLRTAANLKAYPADKTNPDGTVTKADENAVKAWRTSMGVPESADKYEIAPPKDSPYPQFTNYLKDVLHEAGVPAAMAPALAKGYEAAVVRLETELRAKEDSASAAALKNLEMEWGSNYKERVALGQRGKEWLAKEVGGLNEIQLRTLESVLGTPKFMTAMWKFGAGNTEASFAGGDGGRAFEGGASAAQAEWDQIMADRSAGKISNLQWSDPKEVARRDALVERIANGHAT
jgi:peptidoglycan hydrolase-like protein with peptidoglycan-binding domain